MKSIKGFLFIITFSLSCFELTAQIFPLGKKAENMIFKIAETENIDRSFAECIYEYVVTDMELNKTEVYIDILQLGTERSKYFAYPSFRIDSVLRKRNARKNITAREFSGIYNNYLAYTSSSYTIFKNYTDGKIQYLDKVFVDNYIYPDSTQFSWHLSNDTTTFCGYLCQKAEIHFRGRDWIAYYTEDIPISDGPWKFSGLPGLILKIEDINREHCFSAISIRKSENDIYIEKKERFETIRKRFNKHLSDYKTDISKIISGSQAAPKDINGKEILFSNRKIFYNPIELE